MVHTEKRLGVNIDINHYNLWFCNEIAFGIQVTICHIAYMDLDLINRKFAFHSMVWKLVS